VERADDRRARGRNHGVARLPAYLEDHAFLLEALLTLYEASFEERFFAWARALADEILARFGDARRGGFFVADVREVALVGGALDPLLDVVRERYRPHVVLAAAAEEAGTVVGLLEHRWRSTAARPPMSASTLPARRR